MGDKHLDEVYKNLRNYLSSMAGKYLGSLNLCVELLRKSDDPILSSPILSQPLYKCLYVGYITALETYLHDRLSVEVFASDENLSKYIILYNKKHKRKKISNDDSNILDNVRFSLHHHIYHNFKHIQDYFKLYINIDFKNIGKEVISCIKVRNSLAHYSTSNLNEEFVSLASLYDMENNVKKFIQNIESIFIKDGHEPIFEEFTI